MPTLIIDYTQIGSINMLKITKSKHPFRPFTQNPNDQAPIDQFFFLQVCINGSGWEVFL